LELIKSLNETGSYFDDLIKSMIDNLTDFMSKEYLVWKQKIDPQDLFIVKPQTNNLESFESKVRNIVSDCQ
jgi:hypothetical protein